MARAATPIRVAVVGATGYAGRELITLLGRHPGVRIKCLMSSGRRETEIFPIEASHPVLKGSVPRAGTAALCEPLNVEDLRSSEIDLVFLATPHETSHQIVPLLLERGLRVVDLSGAFRLKEASAYPRWRGYTVYRN
jgi:N-acetyl-gamma-glutamyl-phosphate reductase